MYRSVSLFFFLCIVLSPNTLAQSPLDYAKTIVDTLSSPTFAGRGYLDNADSLSADLIANEFKTIGLSPLFDGYEQIFPLQVDVFPKTPMLQVGNKNLQPGTEFLPFPGTAAGSAVTTQKIVDVGAGLFIPNLNINDFQLHDLRNALVVIHEMVPDSLRQRNDVDPGYFRTTTRIAIAHQLGAQAVVVLTGNALSHSFSPVNLAVPAFLVQEQHWPDNPKSVSYTIHPRIDWETTSSNVIGVVPGVEKPNEYLFITAHYDHLGRLGDSYYFPGANDNASGVALVLALAKHFQRHPLTRTLVFIGFSGEEQGLMGSRYFVENTSIPLDQIRFLINLDMVASGTRGIMAVGGSDFESEFQLLTEINDNLGLGRLGKRPNAPNSDHYFFLEQGVKGFFLYTDKGEQPYHHPLDQPESLDWDDFMEMYDLVKGFLIALDG